MPTLGQLTLQWFRDRGGTGTYDDGDIGCVCRVADAAVTDEDLDVISGACQVATSPGRKAAAGGQK